MNILERTTTEEYDEDGRLTSRTTVEKMEKGQKQNSEPERRKYYSDAIVKYWADNIGAVDRARKKHKELIKTLDEETYKVLAMEMMMRYQEIWTDDYENALDWITNQMLHNLRIL